MGELGVNSSESAEKAASSGLCCVCAWRVRQGPCSLLARQAFAASRLFLDISPVDLLGTSVLPLPAAAILTPLRPMSSPFWNLTLDPHRIIDLPTSSPLFLINSYSCIQDYSPRKPSLVTTCSLQPFIIHQNPDLTCRQSVD